MTFEGTVLRESDVVKMSAIDDENTVYVMETTWTSRKTNHRSDANKDRRKNRRSGTGTQ